MVVLKLNRWPLFIYNLLRFGKNLIIIDALGFHRPFVVRNFSRCNVKILADDRVSAAVHLLNCVDS